MTLSVRRGYRKMQPIFFSFVSGLHYRKTVKLYFSRISAFDLVVSICENMLFQCFSSFLTAGNKSYCGTFQRLTHPRQSTAKPIFRPVSPPNRQASQRKPFILSSVFAQTSSHLRIHGTSVPSTPVDPRYTPGAPQIHPQPHPRRSPRHTPDARPDTPRDAPLPTPKSHVIPPGPHSSTAQKPRNINDSISKPETSSRELRAKLLGGTRVAPPGGRREACGAWPGFETMRQATPQRPGAASVEGAGGTGGHGRASRRGAERSEVA